MNNALFSSKSDEWSTPQDIFDNLDAEFHFNLDPCSTHENCKCENHYTKEDNGLKHSWGGVLSILQSTIQQHSRVGREVLPGGNQR